MTHQTIEIYRERQKEIIRTLDMMHSHSGWTQDMVKLEQQLENKFSFLRMRIEEIEEMLCTYDKYDYIRSQY